MYKYKKERYENGENMKNVMMGTYFKGEDAYNFNFGTDLSIADKQRFVNAVASLVVNDTHYNSVIRDLIFDYFIVELFTDIDTTELKDGSSFVADVEQLLNETNIVDIVKANMKVGLLEELNNAVDKSIEYLTGIHPNLLNEALASLVNTLEKKVNEVDLKSATDMAQKLTTMTGELTMDKFVDAYINSDIHKKNVEEIAESKTEQIEVVDE